MFVLVNKLGSIRMHIYIFNSFSVFLTCFPYHSIILLYCLNMQYIQYIFNFQYYTI